MRFWMIGLVLAGAMGVGSGAMAQDTDAPRQAAAEGEIPARDDPNRWDPRKMPLATEYPIAGTRLTMRPPFYYEPMTDSPGFKHESKNILITISELPTVLTQATEGWMRPEMIQRRGIVETGRENLIVNRLPGLLVRGTWDGDMSDRRGILFAAFGVGEEFVLVQARYEQEEAEEARQAVLWLLTSSVWDRSRRLSPIAPLPFRFDIPEGWEVARRQNAQISVLPTGEGHNLERPESARIEAFGQPMFQRLTDFEDYSERTIRRNTALSDIVIENTEVIAQDELTACIVSGTAVFNRTEEPVRFVMLGMYEELRRFVITTWVHEDDADAALPVLDEVVTSLRRLRQSTMQPIREGDAGE